MHVPKAVVSATLALCLASCHRHPHEAGSEEDEIPTVAVTVWDDGYEVFFEHEPVVAKLPVQLAVHVSEIATGRPRRSGPVLFEVQGPDGGRFEHREGEPARDGIYLTPILFPSVGKWTVVLRVPRDDREALVHLGSIEAHDTSEAARAAPLPGEAAGITLLKEQQWLLELRTEPSARRTMSERRKYPAHVIEKTGRRVVVASPVEGRLAALPDGSFPTRGRLVAAGQPLALVEPLLPGAELLALAVKIAEAEADEVRTAQAAKLADAALARAERLEKASATSAREIERSRYEAESARAAHTAAVAVLERYAAARALMDARAEPKGSDGFAPLEIRAPIAGTIVRVGAAPGEFAAPSAELFTILDASVVHIEADVPQHEASELAGSPAAWLALHHEVVRDEADGASALTLVYSGLETDEDSHSIPLVYESENPEGALRVGMSVGVWVEIAPPRDVLAVPESALVDEDGRYVVFVQLAGETFERRPVTLGVRDGRYVEIASGIREGDRVVTSDPWAVRLASLSTSIPEHHH